MKIPSSILAIATALTGPALAETHFVNNNTALPADFRTFEEAHDAAVAGDTIILMPGGSSYGDIVALKRLVVQGGLDLQTNLRTQCGNLSLQSDETGSASGSVIAGLKIGGMLTVQAGSSNCMVKQCEIESLSSSGSNFQIESSTIVSTASSGVGAVFRGCLLDADRSKGEFMGISGATAIDHCVIIYRRGDSFLPAGRIDRGSLTNSIVITGSNDTVFGGDLTIDHCLFQGGTARGTNSTYISQFTDIFVGSGAAPFMNGEWTREYELKAESSALTGDISGGQQGMFGGEAPFVHGFHPAVPRITAFKKLSANPTNGITFRVEASSQE